MPDQVDYSVVFLQMSWVLDSSSDANSDCCHSSEFWVAHYDDASCVVSPTPPPHLEERYRQRLVVPAPQHAHYSGRNKPRRSAPLPAILPDDFFSGPVMEVD